MRAELADTLIELVKAVTPPPESGLYVTEALMDVPLEIGVETRDGELVFFGSAPHSRWKAGFQPETNLTRLTVQLIEEEPYGR
jgi:hypothetical protein